MKIQFLIWKLSVVFLVGCQKPMSPSEVVRIEFSSDILSSRNLDIYLPIGYHSSRDNFPVLYMHDGQMLYDSTTTWNNKEWGVDEIMDREISDENIRPTIVIGIHNGGADRHIEYFPQKPFEMLDSIAQDTLLNTNGERHIFSGRIKSDKYLQFLVKELKPWVDSEFRTLPSKNDTFIAGSSMGALISMYALCEYPSVFGGAACLSSHWPGIFVVENNPIPKVFVEYMQVNLPEPGNNKIYFDYGTETLDSMYEPFQLKIDSLMINSGYTSNDWITRKFEGAAHDETSWGERLHIPFQFLLGKSH